MEDNAKEYVERNCGQKEREIEWRSHPNNGAGVSISYTKADLACELCAFYEKGAGCTESVCCCAAERAKAGYQGP